MDYKKILKSREMRLKILKILKFIPDEYMLKIQYRIKTGRKLNLKNPERFTEKIQWYKLNYRNKLMQQCVDKYEVRDYVESCGLSHILTKCYGIYTKVEDINFSKLPKQFVMKKTNGGGGLNVIVCRDKESLDIESTKQILKDWLKENNSYSGGREWAYDGVKSRIIIEEYLENEDDPEAGISDYKFFCVNGNIVGLVVDVDRYTQHKRNFYDINWNYLDISSDCPNYGDKIPKPDYFDNLVGVAEKLSEKFPFVRVDLYLIEDRVYFGELTFYPWSGYVQFNPDEFDYILGGKIEL